MLSCLTVPDGLPEVLEALRGAFTAPTFATFKDLAAGMLGAVGEHSVTGMWIAAGLAGRAHWARGHRFFSHAKWNPDTLGLLLARLVVALFAPEGALNIVVDDTLFERRGKKVHGAFWQHDGSATGRDGLGRGNCFVICGLAARVPFMERIVFLPLLFRLNLGKGSASKPEQARTMVALLARAFPERTLHVVADSAYKGPAWRTRPGNTTFTTRLAANAVLYQPAPAPTGKRGRPALKGPKLGTCAQIAADAAWETITVTVYGKTQRVHSAVIECLWFGSMHTVPVRVVLTRGLESTKAYDLAVVTTDLAATAADLVIRYSWRWPIEQSIKDCKLLLGVGEARNRVQAAVERTVPFGMLCLTILYCWYQHVHTEHDLEQRRAERPWYPRKTHVSVEDILIAFRRRRITAITPGQTPSPQNSDNALTWALATA